MIKESIAKVVEGNDLSRAEARQAFDEIMQGKASDALIASFITALRMKGETADEIIGAAESMRSVAARVEPKVSGKILDVVGTGGDKKSSMNVSTASAFVAAGAGCIVAKHGNRSVSSRCGAADVLEKLGVKIGLNNEQNSRIIEKIGVAFLFAPMHHPAMKYAVGPRKEIGIRTIFNIVGPITNPANASTYLLGVYDVELAEKLARVLSGLNTEKALVVHGLDGFDEISLSGETRVFEVSKGTVKSYTVRPEEFGLKRCKEEDLSVFGVDEAAEAIRSVLSGKDKTPKSRIVELNAGAAIYANGKASSIGEGIKMAKNSIVSGSALKKLNQLIEESNRQ
ncbi:MAG: anthranilate phosphoribosyltransferase [archaeon GW2011_AR10]|nr:MAG: anthranilate phosphoribosyltransferase [archaeon GW2011_AR10]